MFFQVPRNQRSVTLQLCKADVFCQFLPWENGVEAHVRSTEEGRRDRTPGCSEDTQANPWIVPLLHSKECCLCHGSWGFRASRSMMRIKALLTLCSGFIEEHEMCYNGCLTCIFLEKWIPSSGGGLSFFSFFFSPSSIVSCVTVQQLQDFLSQFEL